MSKPIPRRTPAVKKEMDKREKRRKEIEKCRHEAAAAAAASGSTTANNNTPVQSLSSFEHAH
ncbi:hypothetical protein EUX98_g7097 [Antrodiella citrinella]|uniref:Uncharacterized protein n=1 Tax=Antrodiella citrinella TaxID=2447956 RepID=A0A4S4MMK5_9APHY|nr:hypothetical protein EUX98_g7097 [Antrodiella citrinella]